MTGRMMDKPRSWKRTRSNGQVGVGATVGRPQLRHAARRNSWAVETPGAAGLHGFVAWVRWWAGGLGRWLGVGLDDPPWKPRVVSDLTQDNNQVVNDPERSEAWEVS